MYNGASKCQGLAKPWELMAMNCHLSCPGASPWRGGNDLQGDGQLDMRAPCLLLAALWRGLNHKRHLSFCQSLSAHPEVQDTALVMASQSRSGTVMSTYADDPVPSVLHIQHEAHIQQREGNPAEVFAIQKPGCRFSNRHQQSRLIACPILRDPNVQRQEAGPGPQLQAALKSHIQKSPTLIGGGEGWLLCKRACRQNSSNTGSPGLQTIAGITIRHAVSK